MKIGEAMYKAQQEPEAAGGRPAPVPARRRAVGRGRDDKVVDAEFEEVDDKKKAPPNTVPGVVTRSFQRAARRAS